MIKISVPNDDHVALRAMAKALEEIAVARGAPAVTGKQIAELNYKIKIDTTEATAALEELVEQAEVDTISQQVESLSSVVNREVQFDKPAPQVSDNTTDSTGTPWDERIHSASKTLNADGTWRLRRKPADKTAEEWTEYVKWVEEDIHTVQHGESEESVQLGNPEDPEAPLSEKWDGKGENIPEPTVTPEGDDFHTDTGVVTEQQVASFPPPPPVPVPSVQVALEKGMERYDDAMSKLAENDGAPTLTFPQVMAFLTERHGRITSAQVDQIIADMGLEKITDLNTQPEHTGPFIARVKALLGE